MEDRSENQGLKFNYDAMMNSIILAAVEDLGYDAVNDEGAVTWMDAGNVDADTLERRTHDPLCGVSWKVWKPDVSQTKWSKSKYTLDIFR